MTRAARFFRGFALTWGVACAMACTDERTTGSGPGAGGSQSGSGADNPPPPRTGKTPECVSDSPWQHAFLKSGTCADIAGANGKWIARPLFPGAPEEIRACTYRWSTTGVPDLEVLRALADHVTPNCEPEDTTIAPRGAAVPIEPGSVGAPTGVSGCDVCGRLHDRSAFLILPADKLALRRLQVPMQGGGAQSFDVTPPKIGIQAFVVELPPSAYVFGHVPIFEATPM
jgi:hypothetical protein